MTGDVRGRLIFYIGQIEPLDVFTKELVCAFQEMDYEVLVYDLQENEESKKRLALFCEKTVDAVITFNTMFYNMNLSTGKNAWNQLNIRYITILVDHPDNFRDTLRKFLYNETVLCIDKKHMDYVGRFFPNIAMYGFLPHGGKEIKGKNNELAFPRRKMDVMYAGGIPNVSMRAIQMPADLVSKYEEFFDVQALVIKTCQALLENPMETVEAAIEQELHNMDMWLEEDVLGYVIADFMFIHRYILSYYREKVLENIAKAGIELYIFGGGWELFEWSRLANVHLMGKISAEQVLEEMCNAKIVLSTMAWFKDGSHERIFNGMLAKALVVSETSTYIEEIFNGIDGEKEQDILLYKLNELEELPQRIKYMLSHEEEASVIAENGYNKAKRWHSWKERAKEIADELLK